MPPNASARPGSSDKLLLGVDGGGSKTAAWLARLEPDGLFSVIGRGVSGASNPRAVGMDSAATNVLLAVERAYSDANLSPEPAAVAVLAIAGAAEPSVALQIEAEMSKPKIAGAIHIVPDAAPLFAAGTPDGWGVALIAGTGSVAFGRGRDGQTGTAGGFGYLLGDEGSGYWLGQQALAAVTVALDGRMKRTTMSDAISSQLQVSDARGIKDAIYGADDPRREVASLAPTVVQCADAGDSVATKIVCEGAAELAKLVATVADQIGICNNPFPLALSGSVLSQSKRMREGLLQQIVALGCQADPIAVVADPVAGCLELAAELSLNE